MESIEYSGAGLTTRAPIAIVGIGCRFPGDVSNPQAFWQLLRGGVDAIREIPADRIDVAAYYDPRPATPGKMMTRWGGFLKQIDMFDADFFGISPREADRMDPQQRLLLEVAWEALEDAGQPADRLAGSDAGVFIGMWLNDYEGRLFANPHEVDFYMTTGTGRYSASGRLSYALGLEGPSLTIDTACSSSLVAVHLACQSLWRNECSLALAGGANVILQPHISVAYSQSKMMAPDGRCKFGDAGANGYVRSEGAGIVILKPLPAALKDGDPIYAVIRGTAVNNDGRSSGYMATPARDGQERMLRLAYRDAGISPGEVRYVEAHGTGTLAGDPVEASAVGNVLSSGRPAGKTCYIGSVKTNFGHTEGAAGIAGLIKTALILKHRTIPPSLHVKELNPNIAWKDYQLVIPRGVISFPEDSGPGVAGVSAFGIAGTNAHVVLSEVPSREPHGEDTQVRPESNFVLPLSARSPEALAALAGAYVAALGDEAAPSLYDVCYTAGVRRAHHEHRVALVGASREDLSERLKAFSRGESIPGVCAGTAEPDRVRKVVFVCPGQGSQWVGMGRQLISREPVFRESLERCEEAMRPFVDWSLHAQLHLDPGNPSYRLNEIDVIQPILISIEIALAALWRSRGVEPDAIVGHSMGEVAGAFVAGVLSLEDAMRIICRRSILMRRLSGKGAMAVVALAASEALAALEGFEDSVSLAVSNSPRSTVLSGDPRAIDEILEKLRARDVFCRLVKVDVASHSPQMDLLTDDLLRELEGIQPGESKIPVYSTVTAERSSGLLFDARYWVRNVRCPVLFSKTVQQLAADEHTVFIELSPHPILTPAIEETLRALGREVYAVPSLEREQDEQLTLLSSFGRLYSIGCSLNWERLYRSPGKVVTLPPYPWQRQHFWMETQPLPGVAGADSLHAGIRNGQDHPLLGVRLPDVASLPGSALWQKQLDAASSWPLPEAVFIEMAKAAANAVFGEKLHRISDLTLQHPPALPGAGAQMQLILTPAGPRAATFQIFSREAGSTEEWKRHASGKIAAGDAEKDWLYELTWKQKPLQRKIPEGRNGAPGRWLIFADRGGTGSSVAKLLTARGDDCVLVFAGTSFEVQGAGCFRADPENPEHMRRLLDEAFGTGLPSCRGVLYLWSLDATTGGLTAESLRHSQVLSCDGVLHLIQSLARVQWKAAPRLWLITRAAQTAGPVDLASPSLQQAPLWGLGRVVALEHPDLWGGLVDLPPLEDGATQLSEEILGPDGEDQVALRDGQRYVLRLVRSHLDAVKKPLRILPDATYVITGGLGTLGLRLAGWLTARGARHLVLTGRTGLPDRSTWAAISRETAAGKRIAAVEALEASGASVHIAAADAADEREMSKLWDELGRRHPPVRGIIHAAGIVGSRRLADLTAHEFHEVLRSKVTGAWLLHQLAESRELAGEPLDFFVLFSSGASVWGSQGFAHYAAANHFLDALAHHRAALGLPALSVNWGWWEGVGLVSEELAALFKSTGLKSLPADQALAALAYLLETGATQKIVADTDWSVFQPIFEAKRNRPLLEDLAPRPQLQEAAAKKQESKSGLLQQIQNTPAIERRPLLHGYIRTQVAEVLGFPSSDRINPRQGFFKMGMDSIMTVQLRNRLEVSLGCSLPPTVAFEYPTVDALTGFLAETVLKLEDTRSAQAAAPPLEKKERPPEIPQADLSEEELVRLLEKRLEQIR